jgi:hypothetical protein
MSAAAQIVDVLLEGDDIDPKAFVQANNLYPMPKIKTTFSTITWDGTGDPDGYEEEHGYEDEEGQDMEVDEFDREEGIDVADVAARWLWDNGVAEPSSSHFHPGIWYTSSEDTDMTTGASTTRNFHLEGFTPEEEEKIFYKLFPKKDPQMRLPI